MKKTLIAAVSAVAIATGLAAVAAPALAKDGPEVEIKNAVARMVVIVEDRADVAVEIEPGSANLPRPTVTRRGNDIRIDGELDRRAVRNCRTADAAPSRPGEGASVDVRDHGRVDLSAAPLIVVRTPRAVEVNVGENAAVFGAVGRGATSIELGNAGCGDWTIANVAGPLSLSIAGSGDMWAGSATNTEVSIAGSGDVSLGAVTNLQASIAGSGNVTAATVSGPVEANIAGSGDILVRGGDTGAVEANIAGSGDVVVRGRVASVEANVIGSGDVRVASVSGAVSKSIMGSGDVIVGR